MKTLKDKRAFLLVVGGIAVLIVAFLSANLGSLEL
jgi:hypothetical protein